jgi:hypothetical protein
MVGIFGEIGIDSAAPETSEEKPVFIGRGQIEKDVDMGSTTTLKLSYPEIGEERERTPSGSKKDVEMALKLSSIGRP